MTVLNGFTISFLVHFERLLTETYNPTLENLCTRTARSSRGGHSRRVEKWRVYVHLAVEKGNKFLNILLLRVFFADYCH